MTDVTFAFTLTFVLLLETPVLRIGRFFFILFSLTSISDLVVLDTSNPKDATASTGF
jgi:hypothetical protein